MTLKHVAIIMDGNGRWAQSRGLSRSEGHQQGVKTARRITEATSRRGIPCLTLYALSTENLSRPQEELDALAALMRNYLDNEVDSLIENDVKLRVIGNRAMLGRELQTKIEHAQQRTAGGRKLTLNLAICYGGRDEIIRAARKLAQEGSPKDITEENLAKNLDTAGMPDPDLLIRTGGEKRISNYMLWQMAYSELYFSRVLWPDFTGKHLSRAIQEYHRRERRFGRTDSTHKKKSGRKKARVFK